MYTHACTDTQATSLVFFFLTVYLIFLLRLSESTRDNGQGEYKSILKTGWQIIIFAPLNCHADSRGERAVKGNLERGV